MAKKPSGLGRGLDELLEDNTPSRRPTPKTQKPLVEAKDEFVSSATQKTIPTPTKTVTKPQMSAETLFQNKAKPLYNTQRTTLKANFKKNLNNLNNKDTR